MVANRLSPKQHPKALRRKACSRARLTWKTPATGIGSDRWRIEVLWKVLQDVAALDGHPLASPIKATSWGA
jgi:hypothetical protein